MTAPTGRCRNCGADLAGEFCHQCGQRDSTADHRLGDFVRDISGDLVEWDSRFWRTLIPLLLRPGFLTAEFIAGRRVSYMPPLRLYLVISFLMFLILSIKGIDSPMTAAEREDAQRRLGESIAYRLEQGQISEEEAERIRQRVDEYLANEIMPPMLITPEGEPIGVDELLGGVNDLMDEWVASPDGELAVAGGQPGDTDVEVDLRLWDEGEAPGWARGLEERLERNIAQVQADPSALLDELLERLPLMMFLMLPLFALWILLCYPGSGFHYLQHLVFALHLHSAVFLLTTANLLLSPLTRIDLDGIVLLYAMIYLPLGLVRAYGSGYLGAIGKAMVIGVVDVLASLLIFVVLLLGSLAIL